MNFRKSSESLSIWVCLNIYPGLTKIRMKMPEPRQIIPLLLCLVALSASAQSIGERLKNLVNPDEGSLNRYGILDPDQAFRLTAKPIGADTVQFTWVVAEGYYLYRDKFSFASLTDDVRIDETAIRIPRGKVKQDESFGDVEVNTGLVAVEVALVPGRAGTSDALFRVGYQGCKEGFGLLPAATKGGRRRPGTNSFRHRTTGEPGAAFGSRTGLPRG